MLQDNHDPEEAASPRLADGHVDLRVSVVDWLWSRGGAGPQRRRKTRRRVPVLRWRRARRPVSSAPRALVLSPAAGSAVASALGRGPGLGSFQRAAPPGAARPSPRNRGGFAAPWDGPAVLLRVPDPHGGASAAAVLLSACPL